MLSEQGTKTAGFKPLETYMLLQTCNKIQKTEKEADNS